MPSTSAFLLTHLASYGFVVVAPLHGDCDTGCQYNAGLGEDVPGAARMAELAVQRPDDVRSVVSGAIALSAGDDPILRKMIDSGRVGAIGWSLGGYTILRAMEIDSRFRAGLTLAPATAGYQLDPTKVTQPMMFLQGDYDDRVPFALTANFYNRIPASAAAHWFVYIHRGTHWFSAVCRSAAGADLGCGDAMSQGDMAVVLDRWSTAFLMATVANDARYTALLDPASNADADVTIVERAPGLASAPLPTVVTFKAVGASVPTPGASPGTVLLSDDLTLAATGKLPASSPAPGKFLAGYSEGRYVISLAASATPPATSEQPQVNVPGTYADASIAIDAALQNPSDDQLVSVACRSTSSGSQYRVSVFPSTGQFTLNRSLAGSVTSLSGLQTSPVIHQGSQVNRIELTCQGTTIQASVNGTVVASATDGTFSAGQFWIGVVQLPAGTVGVSATAAGSTIEASFANLVVTQR
jgi:dienelactone hydrolase